MVEMIVALASACIVILATSIIIIYGQRSLDQGYQQMNLQRDASYAMLKMKQSIRGATQAQLDEDGNGVKIYHNTEWIRFWFVPGTKNLLYQLEGEEPQELLGGIVESATFAIDSVKQNTVTVYLGLKNDDCEAQTSSTIMMRNHGA